MSREALLDVSRLYLATAGDVNPARPLFTGDVIDKIEIPGVGSSSAIVIAHPCSIRGKAGSLKETILVAAVETHPAISAERLENGYTACMALPGLPLAGDFHVAQFQSIGLAKASEVAGAQRIACLSEPGINVLQQRLVYHQTRLEVPVSTFQQAFDHTYVECELLEDWATDLLDIDDNPAASFEAWIREGEPSRQERLLDHSERAPIRREMRQEIKARQSAASPS